MNPLAQALTQSCTFVQPFGGNQVSVYQNGGLLGHPGIDIGCGYGTPILSPVTMSVYSVIGTDSPLLGPEGYTQIGGIVETPLETFEFIIGHCDPTIEVGYVQQGQQVATEANHGPVWYGATPITYAMQQAGDKRGSHRHYQKRPVLKVKTTSWGTYLNAYGYYKDAWGNYYQVYNPNNGYAGCVDWSLPLFNRSLGLFSTGYDVYLLQKALIKEGFASFSPTGYFGLQTRAAVKLYQAHYGLSPVGSIGPLTRANLNATYGQLA